jgi:hypothetical protein
MKNTEQIKQNYKSSTLPRLKCYKEYSSDKKINECSIITSCLEQLKGTRYVQDELFELIFVKRNRDTQFLTKMTIADADASLYNMTNEQLFELASLLGIK